MKAVRLPLFWLIIAVLAVALSDCTRADPPPPTNEASSASGPAAAPPPSSPGESVASRDLAVDESMGGHTLARHVGKTDAELGRRLRRERQITSASTYTDRATAERAVAAALKFNDRKIAAWQDRRGRRPNLVVRYVDQSPQPLGRSLSRGQRTTVLCHRILVVLRWNEQSDRFYVLTSYPEANK
jgi:hypothetical protein